MTRLPSLFARLRHHLPLDPAVTVVAITGLLASALVAGYTCARENEAERSMFNHRAEMRLAQVARGLSEALRGVQHVNLFLSATDAGGRQHQLAQLATPLQREYPYLRQLRHEGAGGDPALVLAKTRAAASGSAVATDNRVASTPGMGKPSSAGGAPQVRASDLLRVVLPNGPDAQSGFTVADVEAGGMFHAIIANVGAGVRSRMQVSVYAGTAAVPAQLVYRADSGAAPAYNCYLDCTPLRMTRSFHWAGQRWLVLVEQEPTELSELHSGALALLAIGLIATIAAALYLRDQRSRTRHVVELVDVRTAELASLNDRLQADIAERRETAAELNRSRAELRELAEHNARVKEDERKRIAREIHDDLGQSMLALKIDLTLMAANYPVSVSLDHLHGALTQIDTTIAAMRLIINELRPAVLDLGLDAAIEWECAKFQRRTGISCVLDLTELPGAVDDDVLTALYRIVQESLTNIMRHAHAAQVRIALWSKDAWLFLRIEDDGIGMDPHCRRKAKSYGLIGISERIHALGGQFDTDSEAGAGTILTITLPHRTGERDAGKAEQDALTRLSLAVST